MHRGSRFLPGMLLFTCCLVLVSGCSMTPPRPDDSDAYAYGQDIEGYAEYVFRRQNSISSRIILLTVEQSDSERNRKLIEAEERIIDACHPLNRIAIMKAEKRNIGVRLKYRALDSLKECESRTRDAELLLEGRL